MHKFMNGYGFGSQPIDLLEADRMSHHAIKDDFSTSKQRDFNAEAELPNYHDRNISRQRGRETCPSGRGVQPRRSNNTLTSSSHSKKAEDDPFKMTFHRADSRAMRVGLSTYMPSGSSGAFRSSRAENFHLTSGDYSSIRKAERPSQPHQESPMFKLLDPHAKKRKEARAQVREARESRKGRSADTGRQHKAVYNNGRYEGDTAHMDGSTDTSRTAMSMGNSKGRTRHPLSTPHGVEKFWDRDDAVNDMEIAKRYKGVKSQYI
jgi:hypothetical protein